MAQYVALIKSAGNPLAQKNAEERQARLSAAQNYIGGLTNSGQLKAALPLEMDGAVVSNAGGSIRAEKFSVGAEPIAGLYLIEATNIDTATALIQRDPRLGDKLVWQIEVRPVMALPGITE